MLCDYKNALGIPGQHSWLRESKNIQDPDDIALNIAASALIQRYYRWQHKYRIDRLVLSPDRA
jgi:hypothetical protein